MGGPKDMPSTENVCSQPEPASQIGKIQTAVAGEDSEKTSSHDLTLDAEWRDCLARGDQDVIGLIYDHYAPSLYRVLRTILESPSDAEDALQEVFVRLVQGNTRRILNLRAYLFTAARNEACTMLRRRGRERLWQSADGLIQVDDAPAEGEMRNLLQRLPVEQREVIAMKIYEEMTFAEIAKIVKASPNTVASRYRYGIERLRGWVPREESNDDQT